VRLRAGAAGAASVVAAACALAAAGAAGNVRGAERLGGDWTRFGYDAARTGSGPAKTGITAGNVATLRRQDVELGGTADSSPIYLRGIVVDGRRRDVFVVTTSYGKAVAVDAASGSVLWTFTPPGYGTWAGSSQITNSSPVADPGRTFVYSVSPDGLVHKLEVATGTEVRAGGWPARITKDPGHEKLGPALNLSGSLVLAATGGYIGDAPPYQGHVVALDRRSGRLVAVWNSLCSDRKGLLAPASCPESGSAIWARSGVVVEPGTGNLLVATGDGRWDGKRYWGDSVLMLSPDAGRLLQSWTPRNQKELEVGDVDLGSTAPAILTRDLAVQSGKDGIVRLLDLTRLNGTPRAGARTGGELQAIPAPGGAGLFAAPAVSRTGSSRRLLVATDAGTAGYRLVGGRLYLAWENEHGGTSPVVAGGLLYVYDPSGEGLRVYRPGSGRLVATLPAAPGHWSSPIVTDGRIALPVGSANDHSARGVLSIYRLP
jgi:outer membrane protein assembly factor BamB